MENWEDAKKAMETSKNSAGSATKELDTYLSSIEGKLSRFQATFQSFSSDVLNSGVVKGFIDMGTAALDFADGLVKAGCNADDSYGVVCSCIYDKYQGRCKYAHLRNGNSCVGCNLGVQNTPNCWERLRAV